MGTMWRRSGGRSGGSCGRSGRSSASPGLGPAALLVLFLAAGLRTPLLAALALRRVRNLALVALPHGLGLLLVPLLAQGLRVPHHAGLIAVTLAPALLSGPPLAPRLPGPPPPAPPLLLRTLAR